jgi:hypothetical protein
MTAYDASVWTDFANTVAGGAAALAGLMFVGLSLNLTEVLAFAGVAARAAATLGLAVAILIVAVFVATPGQDNRVLAAEIGLIGVLVALGVAAGTKGQLAGPHRYRALTSMLMLFIPGPLLIIGAFSLWNQTGGGLYWVIAAVAIGFAPRPAMRGYSWWRSSADRLTAGHSLVPRRLAIRSVYSGIQLPPNQKPHPGPFPAGIGVTCWPFQSNGWWSPRPWSIPLCCQSTGAGPRLLSRLLSRFQSSWWSSHRGAPGALHGGPHGSADAVPRPTPTRPASPTPAASVDA